MQNKTLTEGLDVALKGMKPKKTTTSLMTASEFFEDFKGQAQLTEEKKKVRLFGTLESQARFGIPLHELHAEPSYLQEHRHYRSSWRTSLP